MGKNQAYKAMQRARLGANAATPEEINDGMKLCESGYSSILHVNMDFLCFLFSVKEAWKFVITVDGSFHSPEWHAARLASLKTSHTVTWEEFKQKQKEEEMRKGELEADKDRMMREYRAQLDAERAAKLSHGRNHSSSKSSRRKVRISISENPSNQINIAESNFSLKVSDNTTHRQPASKKKKEKKDSWLAMSWQKFILQFYVYISIGKESWLIVEATRLVLHSRRSSDSSSSSSSSESSSSDDEDRESRGSRSKSKRRKKEKKHRSKSKKSSSENEEAGGVLLISFEDSECMQRFYSHTLILGPKFLFNVTICDIIKIEDLLLIGPCKDAGSDEMNLHILLGIPSLLLPAGAYGTREMLPFFFIIEIQVLQGQEALLRILKESGSKDDCKLLMTTFVGIRLSHSYRKAKFCAHMLAKKEMPIKPPFWFLIFLLFL
ncbi:hypothetical protein M9H77_10466 [Catharanthus roseus]|uniref:Uncharacterized protein n=1 Tax=Catharanthus roseus TaxID=4058 RepID=A0ACC0BBW4_CATRO|nr:hypothetical protein M9H77_10466 [Catharanthus roseus]